MAGKISWSNFSHDLTTYNVLSSFSNPLGQTLWLYVSAASFVFEVIGLTTEAETPHFGVAGWCWNFGEKKWIQVFDQDCDPSEFTDMTFKFIHNRGDNTDTNTSGTTVIRDTEASRKCSLFVFRYTCKNPTKLIYRMMNVSYGGVGCMTESEYNDYVRNKPIISNGQLGSDTSNFIYYCETNRDDTGAIAKFNPENTTGQPIKEEYKNNCVPKWF